MSADPILELVGVDFAYPGQRRSGTHRILALEGINLAIEPGERIAILGANGSGKSTLLSHLNGSLKPVGGAVRFLGEPLGYDRRSLAALRGAVAMVFQDADSQIFGDTVREDIAFGPSLCGWSPDRIRRVVDRILVALDLEEWAGTAPLALSHGLRKRVALGGALAVEPRVLVLDEPTAGLDPAGEDALEDQLCGLAHGGTTVVVSTHDVDFASRFARRVVLLRSGRILSDGPVESILSDRHGLRECRLRVPRSLTGMARVGTSPVEPRSGGVHVLWLHPRAREAAGLVARSLEAREHVHEEAFQPQALPFSRLSDRLGELWAHAREIVVFAPVGLCVRTIAPFLRGKGADPAVVCCDVGGRWAVSLLSGHEGGANDLAYRVARLLDAEPVVTTTSEAVRTLVAGIGCRRGVPVEVLREALDLALARIGADPDDLRLLASSEAKRHEAGLRDLARSLGLPLRLVSHREIGHLRPRVRASAARRHFSVPAVSEPAALLAGRRTECVLRKFVHRGVTVSLVRERCAWSGSDPATPSTGP